jgi:hypothetical protein
MKEIPANNLLELAYDLFSRVKNSDFEYVYRGNFSQRMSKKILNLAETNVKNTVDQTSLRNRIYFIMVEGLQNVTKHGEESVDSENTGLFAIQKNKDKYFVTTGNIIKKENEILLRPKLEQINLLEKDELSHLHKEILISGEISDKGGAGLGLIEMARKSGNRLLYDFKPVDENETFFYFRTEIPNQTQNQTNIPSINDQRSIEDIKKLHDSLDKENILVNFNGQFNRENILSLLSIIRGDMNAGISSKKVYNVMVEMLQNISKHTNDIELEKQNRGVFFMSKKQTEFILTSGNYISVERTEALIKTFEFINSLNLKELHAYYDKILLEKDMVTENKTGLGLTDIRIKSEKLLKYKIKPINEKLNFFTLQTSITDID